MAETRRKFDQDFREGAVRETGKPIAQVARELGERGQAAPRRRERRAERG